jgi:hypothetical protein
MISYTSVKELAGFVPIYPEPNNNLELEEVVSEFIDVLFGFFNFVNLCC